MSTLATSPEQRDTMDPWRKFAHGGWMKRIDVREFIIANVTPYDGHGAFLSGPTERTKAVWAALQPYFREEARKGVLDVDPATPSTLTSHPAGYIDKLNEVIVGLQTDKPFKRAIMPWGGLRMVENGLRAIGTKVDPKVAEIFTQYRKTHNDGVFDVYTPEILACRKSHIITGLPDAYGRGRIIGDYRRVALYGVDRLLDEKAAERAQIDDEWPTDDVIRLREELAEQTRALHDLVKMGQLYGFDLARPAQTATEAVQWTYFAYLGAIKEANGAAMSIGRISTFLDIYIERDLADGTLDEAGAQELIDQLVQKLRIVRFLRTPEYDVLFSGDPYWATESIGGMDLNGRTLVTRTSFRMLQTLRNLGPAPEPNLTVLWSTSATAFQALLSGDLARHVGRAVRKRRPDAPLPRRRLWDRMLRIGDAHRQADAVVRRARESREMPALRDQRRPRRDQRRAGRAPGTLFHGRRAPLRRCDGQVRRDDGVARTHLRARDELHSLHARQVLLRAAGDGAA
jgi:formate C-acetyltransferase